MIDNKYHEEYTYKKKRVVVDIARLPSYAHPEGIYEVMAYYKGNGNELAMLRTPDFGEAVKSYEKMLLDFPADEQRRKEKLPPLTGKYAKLRDDLKIALEVGRTAERENPEDGGTCNFDAASIRLVRWNGEKVEQAAKEAGTGCFKWEMYGGSRYVFSPDSNAQANARSRNAEAMARALKEMGYDATDYCQMD